MIVKALIIVVAMSALISVGIVSANPETTDQHAGIYSDDFIVGVLRTSTPTDTATPTHTPEPTATPTHTPTFTPTPTPTPLPETKEYVEPDYISKATAAITTHPQTQVEIWGRELWIDEVNNLGYGIAAWVTADFERRCMLPDGQVAAALKVVTERFPNAEYRYNQSQRNYISLRFGEGHRWFTDRLTTRRTVDTLYSYVDGEGKTRWIDTEVSMNLVDCSVIKLSHFIKAYPPTLWIGGRAYKPDEIPPDVSDEDIRLWGGDIKGLKPMATIPLLPFEVESGDPANIICRRVCE